MSAYDFVIGLAPLGTKELVVSFIDNIIPKLIAYLIAIWAALGFFYLLKLIYLIISVFYVRVLRPSKNLKKCYGEWAVVTGSTDGIGEAMALELARKGLNIVLISRSKEKLLATSNKISEKFPKVLVKSIDIDFSNFDAAAQSRVSELIKDLDIGVLVNNVGISYQYPKYFYELDDERVDQLITVNVTSTTLMTRIVLPIMVKKRKGAIVNISSSAGVVVSPLLSQYSAAKSYIAMFSRSLYSELADYGVHVQVQTPLFVTTKLAKIKKASLLVPTATAYARCAVPCIGYEADISPFWGHAIQLYILSFIPEWIIEAWIVKNMHYGIRKAGLKKEAAARGDEKAKTS